MVGVGNATTHNDTHTKAKKQVLKTIICIDRYLFSCHNIFLVCVLVFLASSKVALAHTLTLTRTLPSTHLSPPPSLSLTISRFRLMFFLWIVFVFVVHFCRCSFSSSPCAFKLLCSFPCRCVAHIRYMHSLVWC